MDISVVICTYNRGLSLEVTLNSIKLQILPEAVNWEVLIVDNNSSDITKDIAIECVKANPARFKYIHEPNVGVSFARNAGIRSSSGK